MIAQGDAQLGTLLALKRQLSQASPATLAMVRAEIAASVATAASVARQADAAVTTGSGIPAGLASASQAARAAVGSFKEDFYEKKIFDPYLHFSSPEDEERYRREEAQRKDEIEKALALHTPSGDLRANTLALDQLKEAGAHGADKSPDYAPLYQKLAKADASLEAQVEVAKPKTEMENTSKADPLDIGPLNASVPPDLLAKLKATGIAVADQNASGHGVNDGSRREPIGPARL